MAATENPQMECLSDDGEKVKHIMDHCRFPNVAFRVGSDCGCEVEIFPAQRFILIMNSSVFRAMLTGFFEESSTSLAKPIDIPDVTPLAFKAMLKFIGEKSLDPAFTTSDVIETLYVANKYDIAELEVECLHILKESLSLENAISICKAAKFFDADLEREACNFIRKNLKTIMKTKEFLSLSAEDLCTLLKIHGMESVPHSAVLKHVIRWLNQNNNPAANLTENKNLKEAVSPLLKELKKNLLYDWEIPVCILQAAQFCNEKDVEMEAYELIRQEFEKIMARQSFLLLSNQNLCVFLEDDNTIASEIAIFKGVLRWATSACTKAGVELTPENKREMMGGALQLIRFPLIPPNKIASHVAPSGILRSYELLPFCPKKKAGATIQRSLVQAMNTSVAAIAPTSTIQFCDRPRNMYTVKFMDPKLDPSDGKKSNWTIGGEDWTDTFTVDQYICIRSFGLSGPCRKKKCEYTFRCTASPVKVNRPWIEVVHKKIFLKKGEVVHVKFPRLLCVDPGTYNIRFQLEANQDGLGQDTLHHFHSDEYVGEVTSVVPVRSLNNNFTNVKFTWRTYCRKIPEIVFHF